MDASVVIVIFVCIAWFCILIQAMLAKKLPLAVNFLLFMVLEAILTNKLTIIGYNMNKFQINTHSMPHFISLILHNDFTVTFVLITFANVFLNTSRSVLRWAITIYTFLFQLLIGAMLRWNGVLTDNGWTTGMESVIILSMMAVTLLLGGLFRRMAFKEGWVR
ncbi:hypothetical protein ACFFK0_30570 [Paenibacillus chartarius]|uniref:Uncharacterized protein n=1 Tax=Paenibacillus chartarius TaxID=747481 RepID=A0ABV6DVR4_9BACL